jgi:hypothetical protein
VRAKDIAHEEEKHEYFRLGVFQSTDGCGRQFLERDELQCIKYVRVTPHSRTYAALLDLVDCAQKDRKSATK